MAPTHVSRILLALLLGLTVALPVWASGDETSPLDKKPSEYKEGLKAIKAMDFQGGVDWMTKAVAVTPKDPDAYNYLGYSYRKLKRYPEALENYKKALELDPDHKGAHEYIGEAYLELNQPEEAQKQLAALDKICWLPCEEYSDLKEAVDKYNHATVKKG
jgi:tetratricopeptide (TPR) repeat protein